MQDTRTGTLTNALAWLEQGYSSLKLDALAVFAVISLLIVLLCAGAYQDAVRQAHLALGVPAPQDSTVIEIVQLVNQYGLALLVAICYFSNATSGGLRREMMIDMVSIALGVLLPQLVFHATTVWTMQNVIIANSLNVNGSVVHALNMEWLIVWVLSMLVVGLSFLTWRVTQRPRRHARA